MSLLDQLTITHYSSMSDEEAEKIATTQFDAVNALLGGLSATGNLAFWASNNPEYSEADAKSDMQRLSLSLVMMADIMQSLNLNSAGAEAHLHRRRGANEQ